MNILATGEMPKCRHDGTPWQKEDKERAGFSGSVPRAILAQIDALLAEAGTGVGKTLGYIAPASLWAERNDGTVWISTYTIRRRESIRR